MKRYKIAKDSKTLPDIWNFMLIIVFTWITWTSNNNGNFGPVVASSAVGLVIGLLDKDRAAGIFTASFAGMVSSSNIQHLGWIVLLGGVTALLFKVFTHFAIANGMGGRLGFIAQLSCSSTIIFQYLAGVNTTKPFFDANEYDILGYAFTLVMLCATPCAAFLTMWIRCNVQSVDNPVTASAAVGLSGAVFFHGIWGQHSVLAKDISLAVYTGTFVGMSASSRIPNYSGGLFVGFIAGLLHISFLGIFTGGYGGKLGTIAFLSTSLFQLLLPIWPKTQTKAFNINGTNRNLSFSEPSNHSTSESVAPATNVSFNRNEEQQRFSPKMFHASFYGEATHILNAKRSPPSLPFDSTSERYDDDSDDPDVETGEFGYRFDKLIFSD